MNIRRPLSIPQSSPAFGLMQGGKAGSKDPRNVPRGGDPYIQPDQEQFGALRREITYVQPGQYSGAVRGAAPPNLSVQTTPIRTQATQWVQLITVINGPVILVPKNLERVGIGLTNVNGTFQLGYSWGPPVISQTGVPIGSILDVNGGALGDFGGYFPVDDLWVWIGVANSWPIVAYEFTPCREANAL